VEDRFALATAKIRWRAASGDALPILFGPAVLTGVSYPTNALRLTQVSDGAGRAHALLAQRSGTFDLELQYQVEVAKKDAWNGITLPTPFALINELHLTLVNLDVDVFPHSQSSSGARPPAATPSRTWCCRRSATRGSVGNRAAAI